ncbi:MAG: HEPN domain-containing protein [Deltaproteobacteria bacterium]|nr:HEPN domain-containing protein [Deltaproteobacteria bacterium]
MTEDNRRENARAEAALGDDALRAAEQLLALGLPNDAVSRAYYAAFHYARALLLTEGLEPRTHRGLVALLEQRFVAAGRLGREAVSAFARLQTFRSLADYDVRERLSPERAGEEVASARRLVDEARILLRAGSWLD